MITQEDLIYINPGDLLAILQKNDEPLTEASLLKEIFAIDRIPSSVSQLFVYHFSLFHALYLLKSSSHCSATVITIETMGISQESICREGFCEYYDYKKQSYCQENATEGHFCSLHSNVAQKSEMLFDPMREFYQNPENILFGDSPLLEKGLDSVFLYIARRKDVERAMNFFGINEKSIGLLKKKYREIARNNHPDRIAGKEEKMKKINYFYNLLKEIYF